MTPAVAYRKQHQAYELGAGAGDCEQLLGRWHYDGSTLLQIRVSAGRPSSLHVEHRLQLDFRMSYVISPLGDRACRFDEWAWAFLLLLCLVQKLSAISFSAQIS